MTRFMRRFSMALSVLIIPLTGLFFIKGPMPDARIAVLILLMFLWALMESVIGFTKPTGAATSSDSIIKICRMLWPLFVVYSWADYTYGWTRIVMPFWFMNAILFLCIAGLAVRLWAVVHLGRSFSYDIISPIGKTLVTTGPYRFVRHPSYLGVCILGAFPALVLGSAAGFAGMALTTWVHTVRRIRVEDRVLQDEFGESFLEYKTTTNGLVPFIH